SAADGFYRIERRQTGRIEHVGAGLLEGLEALDGVVEVLPAMEEILGARRQGEGEGELPRRLDGGGQTLQSVAEIIDRLSLIAARTLDRAADEPGSGRQPHRLGDGRGVVTEAILEIGRDREIACGDEEAAMRHRVIARHRAVLAAEREGETGAGGGERLE